MHKLYKCGTHTTGLWETSEEWISTRQLSCWFSTSDFTDVVTSNTTQTQIFLLTHMHFLSAWQEKKKNMRAAVPKIAPILCSEKSHTGFVEMQTVGRKKKKNHNFLNWLSHLRKGLATWKMSTETGYFQTLLSKQQQTTLQWECHRAVTALATGGQERAMLVSHSHWFWESPKTPWSSSSLSGTNKKKNLLLLPPNFAKPEDHTLEICSEEKVLVPK